MSSTLLRRTRFIAIAIIGAGGLMMMTPQRAVAGPDDVCCQVGNGPRCCGGACEATATTCEACTSYWGCLFF